MVLWIEFFLAGKEGLAFLGRLSYMRALPQGTGGTPRQGEQDVANDRAQANSTPTWPYKVLEISVKPESRSLAHVMLWVLIGKNLPHEHLLEEKDEWGVSKKNKQRPVVESCCEAMTSFGCETGRDDLDKAHESCLDA